MYREYTLPPPLDISIKRGIGDNMDLTWVIIKTLFYAFLWAVFGYLSRQTDEGFQPEKLLSTLLAATIVALLNVFWGIDPEIGENAYLVFIVKPGLIGVIDKLIKVIWRRTGLKTWWENLDR